LLTELGQPVTGQDQRAVPAVAQHGALRIVRVKTLQRPDIVTRPLADAPTLLTYLLRRQGEPSEPLKRFIERLRIMNALPSDETRA
jgi:hypothetical protein